MPDIAHQYRTIVSGAGFRSRADRGRLRFTGADRVSFLQALVTNDLMALKSHQGAYAAYLTPQGRMVTDLHLFLRPDSIVADVPADLASGLAARFDGLVFAEDVQVVDTSAELAQVSVIGGRASAVVAAATGADAAALAELDPPRSEAYRQRRRAFLASLQPRQQCQRQQSGGEHQRQRQHVQRTGWGRFRPAGRFVAPIPALCGRHQCSRVSFSLYTTAEIPANRGFSQTWVFPRDTSGYSNELTDTIPPAQS